MEKPHGRRVILKKGKEKAILNHHHWIFSGAVDQQPSYEDGEILPVYSAAGKMLGNAYFNRRAKIIGRMVSFDDASPLESIRNNLESALAYRTDLFRGENTTGYRLVNGEGDSLPGLIVDRYADQLVIQISTLGMDQLKPWLVDLLVKNLNPRSIYEKSCLPTRKEEGLEDQVGNIFGEDIAETEIQEHGLRFLVSIKEGQKTGFFLDHREMRLMVKQFSLGRRVLNCFAYTGGFSVYAASGGALEVGTVEISSKALQTAKFNMELNGYTHLQHHFIEEDVFNFLRNHELNYDLVILDPPAFAKRQKDVIQACRGYKDINRLAMQKMPPKSFLLTSSCSYHVNEELFQKVVFQASVEAKRKVRIIGRHRIAADHPINICHPESDYLKSLFLYVE